MSDDQQYETLERLVKEGKFECNKLDRYGVSPLVYFIRKCWYYGEDIKFIKLLIHNGADPNLKSNYFSHDSEKNPIIKRKTPSDLALKLLSPKVMILLIQHGAFIYNAHILVKVMKNMYKRTLIVVPEKADKYSKGWTKIFNIIIEKDINLNIKGEKDTPLRVACNNADYNTVKLLLEKGAKPYINQLFDSGIVYDNTSAERKIQLLNILMEYGMKINKKGSIMLLYMISDDSHLLNHNTKYNEDIVSFLISRGVNINYKIRCNNYMYTILDKSIRLALWNNVDFIEVVRFLLEKGADPNIMNKYGSSLNRILYLITVRNEFRYLKSPSIFYTIVNLLTKYGLDINIKDANGANALDLMIYMVNLYETIELLINKGIEINNEGHILELYIYSLLKIKYEHENTVHKIDRFPWNNYLIRGNLADTYVNVNVIKIIKLLIHSGATFDRIKLIRIIEENIVNNTINELKFMILNLLKQLPSVVSLRRLCLNVLPRKIIGIPDVFFQWPNDYEY